MTVAAEVRELGIGDLPRCLALARDRDWAAETRAWLLLLEIGRVYGIEDPDGSLAATVSVVEYGPALAAVGALLVARRHAGRGVGTALVRSAVDRTTAATVWLTATPAGAPLYRAAGFRPVGGYVRYSGTPEVPGRPASRTADVGDLPALVRLDATALGASRPAVLANLFSVATVARVVDGPDGPLGYGMSWRGARSHVLGPVVAVDERVAATLVADLARDVGGPLRIDLPASGPALVTWAERHGLTAGPATAEMVLGADPPGARRWVRTFATGALG
ncbi:GNAT superfamily N-acetyltransferase [Saccharothrix tamanrassetensis]|uniref:GNAT superfamily N-acetyltransferase n=1 Tax=Saccharothrix tamanrassetensis TaxID=1051531 RepID=A0A841CBV4_9PSEU|nr:GNAT family N-acetyltransferase [Saccharothrix tamanrassetensis]MBB5953657.1 GNAT superfamily N-acetyltransferase [Saccharothrix tamanrassetensis]